MKTIIIAPMAMILQAWWVIDKTLKMILLKWFKDKIQKDHSAERKWSLKRLTK
jgi:hypothetical protein